jgi:hypothetical protein
MRRRRFNKFVPRGDARTANCKTGAQCFKVAVLDRFIKISGSFMSEKMTMLFQRKALSARIDPGAAAGLAGVPLSSAAAIEVYSRRRCPVGTLLAQISAGSMSLSEKPTDSL